MINAMNDHEQTLNGTTEYSPTDAAPPPGWEDVQAASAEASKPAAITEMKVVRQKFSADQLHARVAEMGRAHDHYDACKADAKESASMAKEARARFEELATECAEGEGSIEVECTRHVVFEQNAIEWRRVDNGEVVATAAMTAADRQPELFARDGEGNVVDRSTGEFVDGDAGLEADEGHDDDAGPESEDETVITDPDHVLDEATPAKAKRSRKAKASS